MSMYRIRLQQFEGPLDLLLFFIRRDELDVYDIPIARIADEFLEYVRVLEEVDLDGVGDFLYMAALLISIKARLLLPHQETDEEGEPIDPRQELVERLLEYIRFKEAAGHLEARFENRHEQYTRGFAPEDLVQTGEGSEQLVDATVFDLIGALRRVLTQAPEEPEHTVVAESFSIEEQQQFLRESLGTERRSFVELIGGRTKAFVISTFLAVLELARMAELQIFVESGADDFYLVLIPHTESPTDP